MYITDKQDRFSKEFQKGLEQFQEALNSFQKNIEIMIEYYNEVLKKIQEEDNI